MPPALYRIISLLLLAAPAIAGAQGVGKFPGRGAMKGPARDPGLVAPKQVNMVNLLIEHRQELALSDSQFAHIITIKRSVDSTNAPLLRKVDSVERLYRGSLIFSEPSRARRDSIADAEFFLHELSTNLHDHYDDAREKAYGLLNAQQRAKAEAIQAKAEQAIEEKKSGRP